MPTKLSSITSRMAGAGFPKEWIYWFNDLVALVGKKLDVISGGSGEFASINSSGEVVASGKTIPTGDVVGTTDTQTLTHKTLTTPTITTPAISGGTVDQATVSKPTIADFTNATHTHQAGATGGKLDHGAALNGLSDDDHTQYLLLAGRTGGQEVDDDLTVTGTLRTDTGLNVSGTDGYTGDVVVDGTTLTFAGGVLTGVAT